MGRPMHGKRCDGSTRRFSTVRVGSLCLIGLLVLVVGLAGCAKPSITYKAATPPACQKPAQTVAYGEYPLSDYLPLPMQVLEDKFLQEPFDILEAKATAHGSSSAMVMTVQFRDCTTVKVKWKQSPPQARRYNNDPRRELASYAIQKLFLAPQDYVVPVTVMTCIPEEEIAQTGLNAKPQQPGSRCLFGPVAVWLRKGSTKIVRNFLDRKRFARSASGQEARDYARDFANLNIFTYLISHRDGRKGNFLVSTLPNSSHIFSIDNGLAYGGIGNPRPGVIHWGRLKVKKLPRETVAQLRTITPEQLQRVLGTVAESSIATDGSQRAHSTFSKNLDPDVGFRRQGNLVQIGLTAREIDGIARRLRTLLERIDRKEITLF